MGGDVERIKERLDIVEVVTPYLKLEKAGANFKARCPFHNEKTASMHISQSRQTYYCFGCGAKGDMFSFVQEIEGVEFREALKTLAEKAGVELAGGVSASERTEKDRLLSAIKESAKFFEESLSKNTEAKKYLESRGLSEEIIKDWLVGYAENDWRQLYNHLVSLGYKKDLIVKAGLAKIPEGQAEKPPYDVFRGRVVFPLSDYSGNIVGFSGRSLEKDMIPKYLNSPDTPLFTKSDLLYGLDKAKGEIRRNNYSILVEGQIDLLLSHQAGLKNTVASSGTAFTVSHLERLKKLSSRIILAFDGDKAGLAASEKSALLALSLGIEVKIANTPNGKDPADCILEDGKRWKETIRKSVHAIEYVLDKAIETESDSRKLGKIIERKILPMIILLNSSIERSYFITLVAKKTGLKEAVLWDDLRRAKAPQIDSHGANTKVESNSKRDKEKLEKVKLPRKSAIEKRLCGIIYWQDGLNDKSMQSVDLVALKGEVIDRVGQEYFDDLYKSLEIDKEELVFEAESYYKNSDTLTQEISELLNNLSEDILRDRLTILTTKLARAEASQDKDDISNLSNEISKVLKDITSLEEKRKMM